MSRIWIVLCTAIFGSFAASASAALPFSEDFPTDTADWRFSTGTPLSYSTTGGPDNSGYVTRTFSFASLVSNPMAPPANFVTIFRAQEEFGANGSSNGAYIGDWITAGVDHVTAWVRHNAPEPLQYRGRFSSIDNFPGATAFQLTTVPPNVWTQIVFDIDPASPQFYQVPGDDQFEGSNFNDIFSDVGHMQFGVIIPQSLQGGTTAYTFDLDKVNVTVVPEPATFGLLALAGFAGWIRRRYC